MIHSERKNPVDRKVVESYNLETFYSCIGKEPGTSLPACAPGTAHQDRRQCKGGCGTFPGYEGGLNDDK